MLKLQNGWADDWGVVTESCEGWPELEQATKETQGFPLQSQSNAGGSVQMQQSSATL